LPHRGAEVEEAEHALAALDPDRSAAARGARRIPGVGQ
jgi:hypothetical protein